MSNVVVAPIFNAGYAVYGCKDAGSKYTRWPLLSSRTGLLLLLATDSTRASYVCEVDVMITVVGCVDNRTTPMGIVKKYYDDPDTIAMAGQTFSFCTTLSSKERFNRFRIGLRQYQVRHIQIVG